MKGKEVVNFMLGALVIIVVAVFIFVHDHNKYKTDLTNTKAQQKNSLLQNNDIKNSKKLNSSSLWVLFINSYHDRDIANNMSYDIRMAGEYAYTCKSLNGDFNLYVGPFISVDLTRRAQSMLHKKLGIENFILKEYREEHGCD